MPDGTPTTASNQHPAQSYGDEAVEDEVCASGKIGKGEWSGLFEYYDDGEVYLDGVMRGPDFTRPFHIDLTSKGEDESMVDFVNGLLPRVCMALGIRKEVFGDE